MLTCKDFVAELNAYLDPNEEIDMELRRKLEMHVNECPACWVVCDTTKKTIRVFKGMQEKFLPPEVHERLVRALERRQQERAREQTRNEDSGEGQVQPGA